MASPSFRSTMIGHLKIARIDHWVKNVFVLPGIITALTVEPWTFNAHLVWSIILGMLAVCIVTSSNYVINEVLDAPYDRWHPTKRLRPVPAGEINIPLAYVQWIVMFLAGAAIALSVSFALAITVTVLWFMGCLYNISPLRCKDRAYLDVLCEAVNNPLRLLAGWYMIGSSVIPPASLLVSYWMIGCYFMAIKRYAEFNDINDSQTAANYRRSFAYYNSNRLLVSIMFYGSTAMLFLGAFTIRYRIELILAYPLVALVMAIYLLVGLKPNSAAQAPEKLHREPLLMVCVFLCTLVMCGLLLVDIPVMHRIFMPTMPDAVERDQSKSAVLPGVD
jgi:4-hydroxybenzoate polyprenyltransferase